ncbi:MAG: GDSL-type esterase/lipase family protein [Gammaproteobacteria bacterium]|nr:GDSL-type esterase/lipase family protein [Gammaproteobacteria bacterium]
MTERDIRICFVGDSFVNGTGDETTLGWTGRVCAEAIDKGFSITTYNLGVRRNTSHDVLLRIKNEVSLRLSDEQSQSYDARVVISLGVNDTVIENGKRRLSEQESIDNLTQILKFMTAKFKVIIIGAPPVDDDEHNTRIQSLCEQIKLLAKAFDVPYIDLFNALVDDKEYKEEIINNDGAHPKANGYSKLASIISCSELWWFSNL